MLASAVTNRLEMRTKEANREPMGVRRAKLAARGKRKHCFALHDRQHRRKGETPDALRNGQSQHSGHCDFDTSGAVRRIRRGVAGDVRQRTDQTKCG